MIKKLSFKFVLVFLVLVVSVIITSSCYAAYTATFGEEVLESPLSYNDIMSDSIIGGYFSTSEELYPDRYDYSDIGILAVYNRETNIYYYYLFYNCSDYSHLFINSNSYATGFGYVKNGVHSNGYFSYFTYSETTGIVYASNFDKFSTDGSISVSGGYYAYMWSKNNTLLDFVDITNIPIYQDLDQTTLLYEPSVAIDTSFDYSFNGVKRGQVNLEINNLNSSLKMYGYVGCENNFNVGDILDTSSISSYLRLISMYSDNSDLSCYLYEGEKLLYYIVDEDNVILDIGYISEMAEGDFLYGFNVYNGVDFVYLKDGQVYWSNDLTFKYSVGSSSQYERNDVVSMGQSSYITTDKSVASSTYIGYVYDVDGNFIVEASTISSNDLSSIFIDVTTHYNENKVGYNKSCYWLQDITLSGTYKDGSNIDFSDYYVRWSIPTWIELDSIYIYSENYTKRNGIITGFSSSGQSDLFNLQIFELLKNHTKSFDITLEVYDSDDNLVLTHVINSDDIVKKQIASEENNVDKGDYDILDSPNYTGGSSSSPDINNIQNWTSDDYLNLMSTDNFVWEFFKAILGNLPSWITVPITILIFGVVIITLIRFARGA